MAYLPILFIRLSITRLSSLPSASATGIAGGRVDDHRELGLLQPLLIFALQLGKQHIHIGGLAVHWDHAAGSLAGFHQILSQLF